MSKFKVKKLNVALADDAFSAAIFVYIQQTKLKRIHERKQLRTVPVAYFKALENILNQSPFKSQYADLIPIVFQQNEYEIDSKTGYISFSFHYT